MQGLKPRDLDFSSLTAAHERAFRQALAARAYIKELSQAKERDGRPTVATSQASAKQIGDPASPAYLVKQNIRPELMADYRLIDHPALRGWRWAATDGDGNPVFVQGDMLVHPDVYQKLKNNLGRSAVQTWEVNLGGRIFHPGSAVLRAGSEIKHAILSLSGFHQTTLGVHGMEHRVAPVKMPELDFSDPVQRGLVDAGMMVAHYDAAEAFGEGVAGSGLVSKVPGIGPAYQTYVDYLFKSYMPRLKMAMALEALARNQKRYGERLSDYQILRLTADQANAAFGGLNYRMLGRNKTLQDVLRLTLMAPDFLEARGRFVGQAVKPYGREQATALMIGAVGMYTAARILNQMLDDDPHWDNPFSVVYNGREYSLRTVRGDVLDAARNPAQFARNRLSPLTSFGSQMLLGVDRFGDRAPRGQIAVDTIRGNVPIPVQPWTRTSNDGTAQKAAETIYKMVGVNDRRYQTSEQREYYDLEERARRGQRLSDAERVRLRALAPAAKVDRARRRGAEAPAMSQ